jgi:hypothetical protein
MNKALVTRKWGALQKLLYQFQIKAPSSLARLRLLSILAVCLRRLNPRRLDCIFDLKLVLVLFLFGIYFSLPTFASCSEKWPGVDESVVEKYAKEYGRESREPFINTDQGDLLLFVFLLAGTVGGFVAGYSWRMLMVEKAAGIKAAQKNKA